MSNSENTTQAQKVSRRQMLWTGTVGVAAAAASTVMTTHNAAAQSGPKRGELDGKTAFVTGGARGIGLASAEEFAKAGANVVLFDIATPSMPHLNYALPSQADLAAAKARIEALGAQCMTYRGDVRNLEDQQAAMRQAVDRFGSLDIVLANAGVGHAGAIETVTAGRNLDALRDQRRRLYENDTGRLAASPRRWRGPDHLYLVGSFAHRQRHFWLIRGDEMGRVNGFAKSAALAYGRENIMCNVVAPGLCAHTFC